MVNQLRPKQRTQNPHLQQLAIFEIIVKVILRDLFFNILSPQHSFQKTLKTLNIQKLMATTKTFRSFHSLGRTECFLSPFGWGSGGWAKCIFRVLSS